jgi:hypothetical protein
VRTRGNPCRCAFKKSSASQRRGEAGQGAPVEWAGWAGEWTTMGLLGAATDVEGILDYVVEGWGGRGGGTLAYGT